MARKVPLKLSLPDGTEGLNPEFSGAKQYANFLENFMEDAPLPQSTVSKLSNRCKYKFNNLESSHNENATSNSHVSSPFTSCFYHMSSDTIDILTT